MASFLRRIALAFSLAALLLSGGALAEGPVAPGAVPGAVATVDNDGGNGQRWGRAGGRTIVFTPNTPAAFSALSWGVVHGTTPSLAFDGGATGNTPEMMTYNAAASDLAGGRAVWTGMAILPLFNGALVPIPTRFTLTTRNAAGTSAVPLSFGQANPGVNVLASGPFSANLLFEMQYSGAIGGDGSMRPVLDLYDSLNITLPGNPPSTNNGPVMTGVETGFYYTSDTSLSLEDHDEHMASLVGSVKGDTAFMRIEMNGRLPAIQSDLGTIKGQVEHAIPGTLGEIVSRLQLIQQHQQQPPPGGSDDHATSDEVSSVKNELRDMLMILFGIMPCPPQAAALCGDTAKLINDLASQVSVDGILIGLSQANSAIAELQGKVDALQGALDGAPGMELRVEATQVDAPSTKQARYIVKTTVEGALVNATLSGLRTFLTSSPAASAPSVMPHATVITLAPGLHLVTINLVKDVSDGSAYLFEASFGGGTLGVEGSSVAPYSKK